MGEGIAFDLEVGRDVFAAWLRQTNLIAQAHAADAFSTCAEVFAVLLQHRGRHAAHVDVSAVL